MVTPAQELRAIAGELAPHMRTDQPLVIGAKGIEQSTGQLLSQVVAEMLPQVRTAVLSGPSFAAEIARGLPAALTLATASEAHGRALAHALSHASFRCYWSDDVAGAEIGGALKNVYAIAAGIVIGKKLGASAHAALVTRGFAEMMRFGAALGARRETMTGLSGLGDLILTCGSPQSRNMSLGSALGEGRSVSEVLKSRLSVTEGVYTASAVVEIAAARGIEMPIAHAVHAVVSGLATVDEAIEALLARPLRPEG
jgi:glycerol-3-phosphate dehydrogenase (NAD(P)+)